MTPYTQTVRFSFTRTPDIEEKNLKLVYISQQNLPIVEDFKVVRGNASDVIIQADFPFAKNLLNGFTIAVLAEGNATTLTTADVASANAKFGPALITVN